MILNIGGGGGLPIRLIVTAPTGSAVSVTQGATVLAANEVDGVWTFAIPSLGVWTIHATIEGQSLAQDVDISKVGQYNVTLEAPVKTTLNDNDWATIKEVADESKGANYWAVGDTKQITINGKLSDGLTLNNYQTWVYIIGFDHNKDVEGTGIAFCGFKSAQTGGGDICLTDSGYYSSKTSGQWFNINNLESNAGGWASCLMRTATIPAFRNTLPADLLSVIKTTNIYTDNVGGGGNLPSSVTATQDDIYLLAEWEIGGVHSDANSAEQNYQKQYAYYAAGNSRIRGNQSSANDIKNWWERSPNRINALMWCVVSNTGTLTGVSTKACSGFAPAFKVGGAKYTPLEYIASSGTQYIDTGVYPSDDLSVEVDIKPMSAYMSEYAIFGAEWSLNGFFLMFYQNNIRYHSKGVSVDVSDFSTSDKNDIVCSSNSIKVNGTDYTLSGTGTNAQYQIRLFSVYNEESYQTKRGHFYLYGCKMKRGDVLIRDFVPAKDEFGNAGLYDKVEKKFYYNGGTGTFDIPGIRSAGSVSIGQSLYCEENGTRTEYIVVNQGNPDGSQYDASCDGTWLLRKQCLINNMQWASGGYNRYEASSIRSYLEGTFYPLLNIKDIVKQVKVPYRMNGGEGGTQQTGSNGLLSTVFLLSGYEVGWTSNDYRYIPPDGVKLDYFESGSDSSANSRRVSSDGFGNCSWWTRSPKIDSTESVIIVLYNGLYSTDTVDNSSFSSVRPAFIIPSDTYIDEDNNILTAPPL